MKLCVVGKLGNFGSFLLNEFGSIAKYDEEDANTFILAIPASEYRAVGSALIGRHGHGIHLVNVCSIQEDTTDILLDVCSPNYMGVTGIHPLFGPRSSKSCSERVSIVTYACGRESEEVVELFSKISMIRTGITRKQHDEFMARTHYQVVKIADQINQIVAGAEDVPDYMLTPSFKKMRELSNQFMDMPVGTRSSILSNKYGLGVA